MRRIAPILLAAIASHASPALGAPPVVWTASAMTRVMRTDPPLPDGAVALFAARNEWESFQVVVRAPPGGLGDVRVVASDLKGASGRRIPAENVSLFRERYVSIAKNSPDLGGPNRPLGPGEYPDGLVPFATGGKVNRQAVPFSVAGERNEPIWVDVHVPSGVQAGPYFGTISVQSDGGEATVGLTLTVWDFDLPTKPSLRSHFGVWGPGRATDARFQRLLVEHKVMPPIVNAADAGGPVDLRALNVTQLPIYSKRQRCRLAPAPSPEDVRGMLSRYPDALDAYVYVVDEPWFDCDDRKTLDAEIIAWSRSVHSTRAKTLVTDTPRAALLDDGTGRSAVDIWVPVPYRWDAADAEFRAAVAKGNELWSYTALVSDAYSPKWEIDFAPINYRIMPGFISQSLGLTGILYWAVDEWSSDPWADPSFHTNHCVTPPCTFPGEGLLVYPGAAVGVDGPVPSMRLKWIREGVEDYEYVALLRRLGHAEKALAIARSVGADWRRWTHDPVALAAARARLGEALDALHPAPPP